MHFGEKLLNWSEMKANQSEQRIFELLEAEPTATAPEWLKRLADKLPTKTETKQKAIAILVNRDIYFNLLSYIKC